MANIWKRLQQQKRKQLTKKAKRVFRSGSKTEKLCFLLIEKGLYGHLTDEVLKKEICVDLLSIENPYERQIKMSMRIRSLVRDVRMKLGIWIGKVWIPEITDFAWRVIVEDEEFNQLIKKLDNKIQSLSNVKEDLESCKNDKEYKIKVAEFFDKTFE